VELAKKSCRCRYRLQRIERILQSHLDSRLRHELRNALRACMTDFFRTKPAFLPEQAHEKSDRDIVFLSGCLDRFADHGRWCGFLVDRRSGMSRGIGRRCRLRWRGDIRGLLSLRRFNRRSHGSGLGVRWCGRFRLRFGDDER